MKYRLLYTSLAMSASILLGACSPQASYTNGAELERNTVTMVRIAHPVIAEQDGGADLSDFSLGNLTHFTSTNGVGYGDVILFDPGADVSDARIEALSNWFTKLGVTVGEMNGIFGAMPMPGAVTVYVERHVVKAPDCQRWSETSTSNPNNAPGQPFGCVSQSNLAAMIANPRDLVTGESGGTSPDSATKAVKTNRIAPPAEVAPLAPVGGNN